MNYKLIALMASAALVSCASTTIKSGADESLIVFSTSLIDGCDESSYFNNATLRLSNKPEATGINLPIGKVSLDVPFIVKNMFQGSDFDRRGKVHVRKLKSGTYFFTKMDATPMSFVHHETEMLNLKIDLEPGKIHYLGSIDLGAIECAAPGQVVSVGNRTILKVTDQSNRDLQIATKKHKELESKDIVTTIAKAQKI